LLLCASTERVTLAVVKQSAKTKSAERRDKKSMRAGKDPEVGKPSLNFQNVGDSGKRNRWLVCERQPES